MLGYPSRNTVSCGAGSRLSAEAGYQSISEVALSRWNGFAVLDIRRLATQLSVVSRMEPAGERKIPVPNVAAVEPVSDLGAGAVEIE